MLSADYDTARKSGSLVVDSPDMVKREFSEQARATGINYLVLQLAFRSLGHANEMRSLELFARSQACAGVVWMNAARGPDITRSKQFEPLTMRMQLPATKPGTGRIDCNDQGKHRDDDA